MKIPFTAKRQAYYNHHEKGRKGIAFEIMLPEEVLHRPDICASLMEEARVRILGNFTERGTFKDHSLHGDMDVELTS